MLEQKSIFKKVLIVMFCFFVFLLAIFGWFIYHQISQTVQKQLGNKCIGIATAVATLIEQDGEAYEQFIDTLDTDSEYFTQLKTSMEKIRYGNEENITFLYAEIRVSENEMMYIVDGELPGTDKYSAPGSVDRVTDTRRIAYDTQSPYIGKFLITPWGELLSAYVPVTHPSTGEFIGLVGVDVSIEQYNNLMRYQLLTVIGSISALALMVATLLLLSSGKVERLIVRDGLTGAYNKSYFMRCLKSQVKEAQKKHSPLSVFMADLDHFKVINDTYGHPFGDIVLERVCDTIANTLRKTDCFARYGGEEFAAVLPGLEAGTASNVLNRVRVEVEKMPIYNEEFNKNIYVTISIGVTHFIEGQTAEELISTADKALYHAKGTRNMVSVYQEDGPE